MRAQIVIPCFNEVGRLRPAAFDAFLTKYTDAGFVLVNDGSTDGTLDVLRSIATRWPEHVVVHDQQPNKGKAEAVRIGVLRAMQRPAWYVGYFDADLATPLEAIPEFLAILDRNPAVDIVLGARVALLGRRVERRAARHYSGRVFATAASMVLGLPVYDTQCGAKLMRATPAIGRLFERPFGSRWIFDVELIARYVAELGEERGLYELPLQCWTDVGESHVKTKDFVRAAGEIAALYGRYRLPKDARSLLATFFRKD